MILFSSYKKLIHARNYFYLAIKSSVVILKFTKVEVFGVVRFFFLLPGMRNVSKVGIELFLVSSIFVQILDFRLKTNLLKRWSNM